MDAQQQLIGLMTVAEEHHKAVQTALDGLAAERAVLAKERAALSQLTGSLQKGVTDAAIVAVHESLAGASTVLESATRPVVGSLSNAARATDEATGKLTGAVSAFGWKWALVAGGATAGCILAVLAVTWVTTATMRDRATTLSAEVATLQAQAEDWEKRAGRAKLTTCGEKRRLCVQVDTRQSFEGGYYIIKGY
ncbi:hypothetical protein RP726_20975 (plasmid) [Candidatus Methylospira mobilis]|uniref:hypothetical protein n=1 Tax=Candidatus Methylospira mobilis TaxID=1808979 RepID=UPI0028ED2D01|nr:hypothetical protein [Candidatus Methylospira mobilis]WNV06927.1 hypothetical protein RP726_20975 [Candidatus Methylospira mobilis]